MTPYVLTWIAIGAAGALAFATKFLGHVVPESWLANARVHRIAAFITVALLAALFAVQGFTAGSALVIDARMAAVAGAAVMLWLRAPFIVVVFGAAAIAAGLRLMGWG